MDIDIATKEKPSLLDQAIQEMEDLLYALRDGTEKLDILDEFPPLPDILPLPVIPQEEDGENWLLGLYGHGIQSQRFFCHWESRRLTFDFLLPYERVLQSPDVYQAWRKILVGCCFLALAFLLAEKDGVSYSPNDEEAGIRVTCDSDNFHYLIHHGETVLSQGDEWKDLEKMLDTQQREDFFALGKDLMIFIP